MKQVLAASQTHLKFTLMVMAFFGVSFSSTAHAVSRAATKKGCISNCVGPQSEFGIKRVAKSKLPADFRLVVWNVYKGGGAYSKQAQELKTLGQGADLMLFQDATDQRDLTSNIKGARPDFHWTLAHGDQAATGRWSGVVTGSNVKPLKVVALRSKVKEPITETTRSILVSTYAVNGTSERLMVVNIHAVSYASTEKFKQNLKQMEAEIKRHRGPVVLAGDFNAWRPERIQALKSVTARQGLKPVAMERASVYLTDHVFTRGVKVRASEELQDFSSSDQRPLAFDFTIESKSMKLASLR